MLHRLAKIINQIMRFSKNTADNQPVDAVLPPTSAIGQHQQTVDGSQTTIAGDVSTEGGMVDTGNLSSSGGGIAGGAGSLAAGANSTVIGTVKGDHLSGDEVRKVVAETYIEAVSLSIPFNLHQLEMIAEAFKAQIGESFVAQKGDFALGLYYLDYMHYRKAINAFAKAHDTSPISGKPLYYETLARCGVWRQKPSRINRQDVQNMEEDLALATETEDSQAHYWYLWALIKHEYYKQNYLRMDAPLVGELLVKAKELFIASTDKKALLGEIRQMQRHVKDTDGFIDSNINPLIGS